MQSPQKPEPHFEPIKRSINNDQPREERRNVIDIRETPIKGLEKDQIVRDQEMNSQLKRTKSSSNQKIKVVSAMKRKF